MAVLRAALCVLAALALAACGQSQSAAPASPAAPATEAAAPGERVSVTYASSEALLILGADYGRQRLGWNQLDQVPVNGRQVQAALEAQGFTVTVLNDPTSAQMRAAITEFTHRQRDPNALTRAVIYYAGHGATSLDPQSQRVMGYIVPLDAADPDRDINNFRANAVPMSWVKEEALASTARHTLLVFDSCFSSSIFSMRSGMRSRSFQAIEELSRRGVHILTASDVETPDAGPFTQAFVDAIAGGADVATPRVPADGIVTALEVGIFVKNAVLDSRQSYGTPGFSPVDGVGEIMFSPDLTPEARAVLIQPEGVARALEVAEIFERRNADGTFTPVDVVYYRKDGDGTRVTDALSRARVPFQTPAATLRVPEGMRATTAVNAIACSSDVPGPALRFVALALHDAGIPLRAIVTAGRTRTPNLIQVYTSARRATNAPLTRAQLEAIEACPASLQNAPG